MHVSTTLKGMVLIIFPKKLHEIHIKGVDNEKLTPTNSMTVYSNIHLNDSIVSL